MSLNDKFNVGNDVIAAPPIAQRHRERSQSFCVGKHDKIPISVKFILLEIKCLLMWGIDEFIIPFELCGGVQAEFSVI